MTYRSAFVGSAAALLLAACGGAGFRDYEPIQEQTKLDAEQLLTAAQRTIDKLGYRAVGLDRVSHTVGTREKDVGYSSVPRLSYKYSFKIETSRGLLVIDATCVQNSATSREEFTDCGDERPKQVIDEMEELRVAILETAKTIPKGPVFDEPMDEEEPAQAAPAAGAEKGEDDD